METSNAVRADMSSSRSIHTHIDIVGLKYIFWRDSSIVRRIIWAVLLVLVTILFIYSFANRLSYYMTYSKDTDYRLLAHPEQPFPRVTICNQNKIQLSSLPAGTSPADFADIKALYQNDVTKGVISSGQWQLFYRNHSQSSSQMVLKCSISGKECSSTNLTETITDIGVCYSLITTDRTNRASREGGIKLILNAQKDEYTKFGGAMVEGFQVVVNDPDDAALVKGQGISITGGVATDMTISRTEVKRLKPPYGACDSMGLSYYRIYSQQACLDDARTRITSAECNCTGINIQAPGVDVCLSSQETTCADLAFQKEMESGKINCPSDCGYVSYKASINQATLSQTFLDELATEYGQTSIYWAQNAVVLNVYYSALTTELVEEKAEYSIATFFRDIGFYVLLYFGTSILVFAEIIDYIIVALCCGGKKSQDINSKG